jgi:hypothetical protein
MLRGSDRTPAFPSTSGLDDVGGLVWVAWSPDPAGACAIAGATMPRAKNEASTNAKAFMAHLLSASPF